MEYKVYRASQRAKGKMLREYFSGMPCFAQLSINHYFTKITC